MSLNRILLIAIITMVIAGGLLSIVALWIPVIDPEVYWKLMVSLGILTLLAGLVMVLKIDLGEHKKLKDENYLD